MELGYDGCGCLDVDLRGPAPGLEGLVGILPR